MTTPNFIPGMKMKGIGRRSAIPHYKNANRKWLEYQAKQKKIQAEDKRKLAANRPYME